MPILMALKLGETGDSNNLPWIFLEILIDLP